MKNVRRLSLSRLKYGCNRFVAIFVATCMALSYSVNSFAAIDVNAEEDEEEIVLRVCNWEEYIDLGEWDEEEKIELDNGETIFGENTMMDDFEEWYYETYGKKVRVEYSCFGTNEDLYNQLNLGDVYDLVCPSDYLIMKLMAEGELQPLSDEFFDESNEYNYYTNGVSGFIDDTFKENEINGETWDRYAACYMWGVTGILYNPDEMTDEEASTWNVFRNPDFKRRITIKDNVRDSMFAAIGAVKADKLLSEDFINDPNYSKNLLYEMNDVSEENIAATQDMLQEFKDNAYAFETDSGKADIVSGKIAANYQWSGDAVYAMDLAEEDGVNLKFAVPEECTDLWFDGWVMLKSGIDGDSEKQQAAEAFINFLSRPDNAVRNMYYIGYTSAIAGGDDDTIFEYLSWNYSADEDEDEENLIEYPVGFFFTGDEENPDYIITTTTDQIDRQLYAQYPSQSVLNRSCIMEYFDDEASKDVNQMWINVRCYNIKNVKPVTWAVCIIVILAVIAVVIKVKSGRYKGNGR